MKYKVLIIDDMQLMRREIPSLLRLSGYEAGRCFIVKQLKRH